MGTADAVLKIVEASLRLLAGVAPDVAKALTGGQSVEEAIAEARKVAKAIPDSTEQLEASLAARKERG